MLAVPPASILGNIFRQVADAMEGKACEAYIASFDVRLPKGDEQDEALDTVVQPDLSVVCDPAKLDEKGCRGAPDWIVEVLSHATASHDHLTSGPFMRAPACANSGWYIRPTASP